MYSGTLYSVQSSYIISCAVLRKAKMTAEKHVSLRGLINLVETFFSAVISGFAPSRRVYDVDDVLLTTVFCTPTVLNLPCVLYLTFFSECSLERKKSCDNFFSIFNSQQNSLHW